MQSITSQTQKTDHISAYCKRTHTDCTHCTVVTTEWPYTPRQTALSHDVHKDGSASAYFGLSVAATAWLRANNGLVINGKTLDIFHLTCHNPALCTCTAAPGRRQGQQQRLKMGCLARMKKNPSPSLKKAKAPYHLQSPPPDIPSLGTPGSSVLWDHTCQSCGSDIMEGKLIRQVDRMRCDCPRDEKRKRNGGGWGE